MWQRWRRRERMLSCLPLLVQCCHVLSELFWSTSGEPKIASRSISKILINQSMSIPSPIDPIDPIDLSRSLQTADPRYLHRFKELSSPQYPQPAAVALSGSGQRPNLGLVATQASRCDTCTVQQCCIDHIIGIQNIGRDWFYGVSSVSCRHCSFHKFRMSKTKE